MAEVKKNHIYENKLIMSIANSSLLRSFANEYLGATPFLHNIQMWYSFPHPTGRGQSESAQLFHYDMDGIKWVKFFIHLTDTNPETGMHCFVPGTHLVGAKNRRLLAKGYSRIEDAEMREWQSADFRYISAKAGQIVCGDTKCWHKGSELLKGKRLMLQIQYSINPFSQNYGI
jgi:ectoine hydroxylase-related dioxygenase (phytanoyl-CoA dioxygenase family)